MTKKFMITFWSHYHISKQLKGKYQDEYKFISFYNSHNVNFSEITSEYIFGLLFLLYMVQNLLKFIFFFCTFWLYVLRLNFPEFLNETIFTNFLDFWIICQSLSLQKFWYFLICGNKSTRNSIKVRVFFEKKYRQNAPVSSW